MFFLQGNQVSSRNDDNYEDYNIYDDFERMKNSQDDLPNQDDIQVSAFKSPSSRWQFGQYGQIRQQKFKESKTIPTNHPKSLEEYIKNGLNKNPVFIAENSQGSVKPHEKVVENNLNLAETINNKKKWLRGTSPIFKESPEYNPRLDDGKRPGGLDKKYKGTS